jgi:phosphatidylglycerol:prolipoprotein diacylglycerol transferase
VVRIPDWIPVLGDQAITSFGVMLLVAFLVAGTLFVERLRRVEPDAGWDLVVTAVVAGLLGAKALHLLVHTVLGLPSGGFGRAGLDFLGGLAGGAAGAFWHASRAGIAPGHLAGAAAAPLALGYAIGRVGSFLVGADFGHPTGLPWGVAFPRGAPPTTPMNLRSLFDATIPPSALHGDFVRVHPTQLYEAALAVGIFGVLRGRWPGPGEGGTGPTAGGARSGERGKGARVRGWHTLALFLLLWGAVRALIELLRLKQDRLVGPITVDLLLSVGVVALGTALWRRTAGTGNREVA